MHSNATTLGQARRTSFSPSTETVRPARSPSPTSCTTAVSRISLMADPTSSQLVHVPDGGDSSGSRQQETEGLAGDVVGLARPIIEVRELVESFRSCHLVVDGWADTVREAAGVMTVFERRHPGTLPALARVIADVDVLLRVGWVD